MGLNGSKHINLDLFLYMYYIFLYIITYVVIQFYNSKERNSEIQISDPPYKADNKITKPVCKLWTNNT